MYSIASMGIQPDIQFAPYSKLIKSKAIIDKLENTYELDEEYQTFQQLNEKKVIKLASAETQLLQLKNQGLIENKQENVLIKYLRDKAIKEKAMKKKLGKKEDKKVIEKKTKGLTKSISKKSKNKGKFFLFLIFVMILTIVSLS